MRPTINVPASRVLFHVVFAAARRMTAGQSSSEIGLTGSAKDKHLAKQSTEALANRKRAKGE